ncbi:MAG: hypothetical protein ABI783_09430 [Actinomycetota bacterium]
MIASLMRQDLTSGTVTFLFTDVEGSTAAVLGERLGVGLGTEFMEKQDFRNGRGEKEMHRAGGDLVRLSN